MLRRWCFYILLICGWSTAAEAAGSAVANFAENPQWLALGHYRPHWLSGWRSSIDSDNFFLAADGKDNPAAELFATIKLFEDGKDIEKICLFPARYKILRRQGLVSADFPNCAEYEQFRRDLRPAGVTVLFTDAYMNNPSSLFGHTLLRIDTTLEQTQMTAHGANYGAFTNDENGVLFAVYGLTGGYYGGWTVKPYYDILNMYNNLENRDIWELKLNFSADELDTMVAHLWEAGHTETRYYFFTKNCSYMIMELLDAVRPNLHLADKFPLQAIPLDTFKAVYRSHGLAGEVNYRPSRQSKILHRLKQMNPAQKKAFTAAALDDDYTMKKVPSDEQADVLETVYQYVQYQYVKKELPLAEYRRRSFEGLTVRNRLGEQKARMSEKPEGHSPLLAHESMRATLGLGSRNGEAFQELLYRPAYHSLTDNNYGLLPGAEINFLNFTLRHYDRQKKALLQELNLLGIKSLAPADRLFAPIAFSINVDVAREQRPDNGKYGYVTNLKSGGGVVIAASDRLRFFAFANAYGSAGALLPHNQYVGIGPTIGLFADFQYGKFLAEAEKVFASDWYGDKTKYRLELNVPLSTNWSVAAIYKFSNNDAPQKKDEKGKAKEEEEVVISLRHYF